MLDEQVKNELVKMAKEMVAPGQGILAADESTGTMTKRLDGIGVESTPENRRTYRQLLFTAPNVGEFISGVILFDETLRQKADDGTPFPELLRKNNMIPGIKTDEGLKDFSSTGPSPLAGEGVPSGSRGADEGGVVEKVTKGADGLKDRYQEYYDLGARFAKFRSVFTISDSTPTDEAIKVNAIEQAKYAKTSQEFGIVPIVEPEVLMTGSHDIKKCEEVTTKVLRVVFETLKEHEVLLEGVILKPNMALPGEDAPKASPREVAEATIRMLKNSVPAEVPGIVFLSGGQSEREATENLNEMNKTKALPWELSFSYGRALQASVLKAWAGKADNKKAAQKEFYKRAKLNSLARTGEYSPEME